MIETIPTATNLAAENADASSYAATISGQRWSGITDKSRFWASVQKALADGAPVAPYVAPAQPAPKDRRAARYKSEADPLLLAALGYQVEVDAGVTSAAAKRDQAKADYLAAKAKIRAEIPD